MSREKKPIANRSNDRFKTDRKSPPSDGIFLDGNGSNWELFERLYKENARRTFGRLIDELDLNEDINFNPTEPEGDPDSFAYKMAYEIIKNSAKVM